MNNISVNFKTLQKNQGHVIVMLSGGEIVNIKASWSMNAITKLNNTDPSLCKQVPEGQNACQHALMKP